MRHWEGGVRPAPIVPADPEHLAHLSRGTQAWNEWRADNPGITPVLNGADLKGLSLPGADLSGARLEGADLLRKQAVKIA